MRKGGRDGERGGADGDRPRKKLLFLEIFLRYFGEQGGAGGSGWGVDEERGSGWGAGEAVRERRGCGPIKN